MLQYLIETLEHQGIVAIEPSDAPPVGLYTFVAMKNAPEDPLTWLQGEGANATHLRIDCSFFRLPPAMVMSNSKHIWAVLGALRPSATLSAYVQTAVAKLRNLDTSKADFNFLHLRLENDWLGHCNRWGSIPVRPSVELHFLFLNCTSARQHHAGTPSKCLKSDCVCRMASSEQIASTTHTL